MSESRSGRRPNWAHRGEQILARLEAIDADLLDRRMIEQAFTLRQTEAQRLMRRVGAIKAGTSLMVSRELLVAWVKNALKLDFVIEERERVERLHEKLETAARDAKWRAVKIQTPPASRMDLIDKLPPGVELNQGELRVKFFGTEDLLRILWEFSQYCGNNYAELEALCGDASASKVVKKTVSEDAGKLAECG